MIYVAFVLMEELGRGFSALVFWRKKESAEQLGRMKDGLVYTFPFLHASNAENPHPNIPITTKAS